MKNFLTSDNKYKVVYLQCPSFFFKGMTNNARLTFRVGDTTHAIYNTSQARKIELVTLNTIFSVLNSTI